MTVTNARFKASPLAMRLLGCLPFGRLTIACRTMARPPVGRLLGALLIAVLGSGASAAALDVVPPKAVVELFTSQGCSSCPPADRLLEQLAKRGDVIALTMPVDYWDYLGWKDRFGKSAHTTRQKHYAMMRRDGEIYTPQMVINGRSAVIGSRRRAVDAALKVADARAAAGDALDLNLSLGSDTVSVSGRVGADGDKIFGASVWLLAVQSRANVKIRAGENRGRKITYANVVRRMTKLGTWTGSGFKHRTSKELCFTADNGDPVDGCVVLVQVGDHGMILGARALDSLNAASKVVAEVHRDG